MASIPHPNHYNNLPFNNSRFSSLHPLPIKPSSLPFHSLSLSRISDPPSCRCHGYSSSSDSPPPSNKRWDSAIQDVVRNAIKKFDEYMNSNKNRPQEDSSSGGVTGTEREEDEIWDWDRWKKHFVEVDEQERVVSILKSQLDHAVNREDYQGAARLKVAIAAAATNDTVGRVLSHFNRAIEEESYEDAALIRDYAGAGLVGWWAGISEDVNDPYGRIIRITCEHGRYVARGYSPRQLTTATTGVPLFEIFLTIDEKGEYKQQAVYLKRRRVSQDSQTTLSRPSVAAATAKLNTLDSTEDKSDLFAVSTEDSGDDEDRDDDSDVAEGLSSFQSILRDMIPGVKVKVLKVTAPEKVDRDMISKVIDNIMDEEDDEKDADLESLETEDEAKEGEQDQDEVEVDGGGVIDGEEQNEIGVKVVVGGLMQKLSGSVSSKDLLRVPARLEKKGRLSFTFSIEKDPNELDLGAKGKVSADRKANSRGQRSVDHVMFDLAKFIGRGRIPLKVLKDINDLINLTLSQAQNRQPLAGSTIFNRIEMPASLDPLNGLYIGAHGLYASEVIHLRRKFGQWQEEDGLSEQSSSLEFYEYVEALKLTGDPFVPAGQIAFRAKVGKRNQLPHKGIIPEEFGVIARYRGQGRLAEPGFRNPRWVDGELVILDGKYIKGGPVVGFVYWAPEYHFLVFFNRLRLQE